MTVRVKIDITSGVFELEGDKDFVAEHLEKLMPIISKVQPPAARQNGDDDNDQGGQLKGDDESERKKRRIPKRNPGAPSCRDRILLLKGKGFFKSKRTPVEIRTGLETEGWTYQTNQISAALTTMFTNGEVKRTKEAGAYKYFADS